MKRFLAAILATLAILPASASMENDGAWASGVFATTVWADGVWYENVAQGVVPDVVGQASAAAADAILEGDGFDAGTVFSRCSAATADEIIAQNPAAGAMANLGSTVDLYASNGQACRGRNRVTSPGGILVR